MGYTPKQLFALENFCDILSEEQTDNLLDHIDFIRDEDADVATNGPEVFTLTIRGPDKKARKFWCAMHVNSANANLVICEFELEDDPVNPLVPSNELTPELPEDTLQSNPTAEEYAESTQNISRPLRVLRSARKRKGEAAAMEVFNIMSQVQEQLAAAPNLDNFLKVLVGVVKELTGFHRVMVYQFDAAWNGRVVTELVDPRATKDLYKAHNPSGYIIASSDDLLKLFDADFGLLSIRDETKILGDMEQSQEALAMLEYLRMRKITSVTTSQDVSADFPDLRYPPGFQNIAGMLIVPLSVSGTDFIVFFRKGQLKEVKWAGNPYEKFVKEGTEGYLEPRKSFKTWSETVVGKCREWSDEEIETAAVLCLVYGKFIEVWRQKEAALQSSQLTRLLLANSAHEVRTPLNAIINYLEIALEGTLDSETRENLAKSHSASKSLIYVINDLLDLTKTEEGGALIKGEVFDLKTTFKEATDAFFGDAKRKGISYAVHEHPGVPMKVLGDQRRVRQAISNVTANAIQHTSQGGVKVDMYVANWDDNHVNVEIAVADTGAGMSAKKLDALFRDLEQVQTETTEMLEESLSPESKRIDGDGGEKRALGLGLAVVSRVIRNMNGQLRLRSEEGKGSRFIIQLPFDLPNDNDKKSLMDASSTPQAEGPAGTEVTLVEKGESTYRDVHTGLIRRDSADSVNSKKSRKSLNSLSSANSTKSDVDRLIEAIQEPHMVEKRPPSSGGERSRSVASTSRPSFEKRATHTGSTPLSPTKANSRPSEREVQAQPNRSQMLNISKPGQADVPYSGFPIKAIRMPEDTESPTNEKDTSSIKSGIIGEVDEKRPAIKDNLTADHMRVLVAEDDPVNSRIVKKRLEKLGHEIFLTVNGEECASVHGEKPESFDVVLMDMQMPIVDGLTSTKMIRSFEKSHPANILSPRASLNGRIPIIAVSASLEESKRQSYIDAGFDAWILKPISFPRLQELMAGIVDPKVREEALFTPGFHQAIRAGTYG
ncbi:hypothetical protein GTA08_BOTSDO01931 [Neofusicoccum parvum]|nr:hypothetical protein GTA08_BOTSDO01931 [Neofusicoccum parvum]